MFICAKNGKKTPIKDHFKCAVFARNKQNPKNFKKL